MKVPVEGEVLAGKYRVERILGKGGMGVVVAAMHLQLGQRVAIKFLLEDASKETVSRFIREARAAVRLRSEHTARVLDVGDLQDGAPYMVMEYLDGNDLSHLVRSQGALPTADAVLYVLYACEAMAEAHSLGIIHRDLKPANLFLTRGADGALTVKVLDFGISKTLDEQQDGDEMGLTRTGSLLGSPLYMSPEQLQSARRATVQSDIWSLGVILYQLLAGKVPFYTRTLTELIMMINLEPAPPMAALREGIPPGLEAAALRCLEKKPEARFANVGELAWAIAEYGPPEARASAEKTVRTLEAAGVRVQLTTEASGAHRAPSAPVIAIAQPRSVPPHSAATLSGASTLVFAQTRTRKPLVMAGVAASVALAATVVGLMMRRARPPPEHGNASAASVAVPAAAEIAPTPTVATAALASASAATEPTVVAPPPAPPPDVSATPVAAPRKPATGPGSPAPPASPAPSAAAAPTTTAKSNPLDIRIKE